MSKYLRWILNQVARANMISEPDGAIARFYEKLRREKGPQKAIVAHRPRCSGSYAGS